ncbi:hypothetical protein D3C84_1206370 [compost metagenome]
MLDKILFEIDEYFKNHPSMFSYFKVAGTMLLALLLFNSSSQLGKVIGKLLYAIIH